MKLVGVLVVGLGLVAACAEHGGGSETSLLTASASHAPGAKSDVGTPTEADASAGTPPTTADASLAAEPSTFTMTRSCYETDAGACAFTAAITAEDSRDVSESCDAMMDRGVACGALPVDPQAAHAACDAFGKSMRPAMKDLFDCESATICSDAAGPCAGPAPTTLGDQVCAAIGSQCADDVVWFDCSDDGRSTWNALGGDLRPDAANAGLSCLTYACGDMRACLDAWQTAIGLPPALP